MKLKISKLIAVLFIVVIIMNMKVGIVFAAATSASSSIDTSSVPYKESPNTYLITSKASISWKKFNNVLGYNDLGTVKNGEAKTETYENRVGDALEGAINYSWTIKGDGLEPITENKKSPIFLGITTSSIDNGVLVVFETKRVFNGEITIKLNVDTFYSNNDQLTLTYIDGADSSQIHGSDTTIVEVPSTKNDGLIVQDGFIEFAILNGGNYTLTKDVVLQPAVTIIPAETIPESTPETIPETSSEATPEATPETTSEATSEATPEATLETTSDTKSVTKSEIASATDTDLQNESDNATELPKTGSQDLTPVYILCIVITGISVTVFTQRIKSI